MAWLLAVTSTLALAASAAAVPAAAAEAPTAAPTAERPAAASDRSRAVDRALDKILDERYQRFLPGYEPAKAGPVVERRPKDLDRDRNVGRPPRQARDRERERDRGVDLGPLGTIVNLLMWAVLAVVVILGVVWIVREMGNWSDDPKLAEEGTAATVVVDQGVIERPLGDADELANQGRYAEAIHTLLLRTFQELARTSAIRLTPSLTSREILARMPLIGDARDALAGLVTVVEVTHFGDDVPGVDDYARCRDQFHRFATAYQRGGANAAAAAGRRAA